MKIHGCVLDLKSFRLKYLVLICRQALLNSLGRADLPWFCWYSGAKMATNVSNGAREAARDFLGEEDFHPFLPRKDLALQWGYSSLPAISPVWIRENRLCNLMWGSLMWGKSDII